MTAAASFDNHADAIPLWRSWSPRHPVTVEITGSSPVWGAGKSRNWELGNQELVMSFFSFPFPIRTSEFPMPTFLGRCSPWRSVIPSSLEISGVVDERFNSFTAHYEI